MLRVLVLRSIQEAPNPASPIAIAIGFSLVIPVAYSVGSIPSLNNPVPNLGQS